LFGFIGQQTRLWHLSKSGFYLMPITSNKQFDGVRSQEKQF
jgi:hypothetical protein